MRHTVYLCALGAAAVVLFVVCGKKEAERPVIRVGNDSLGLETIRMLVPDSVDDSIKIKRAVCRLALATNLPPEREMPGEAAEKCARKLTLISGIDYSIRSAEQLLEASSALAGALADSTADRNIISYIDSLVESVKPKIKEQSVDCGLDEEDRAALMRLHENGEEDLEQLLVIVLKVSDEIAATLASFVREKDVDETGNIKAMVKGLIADTTTAPSMRAEKRKPASLSTRALVYRSQETIRDSIGRHIYNLQQLYKRHLKTGDYASGTVWVTFHVDWEGRVSDVRITRSAIQNQQFLERFGQYLRIIKFKAVPQSAGTMTFEFPFEFKAEE